MSAIETPLALQDDPEYRVFILPKEDGARLYTFGSAAVPKDAIELETLLFSVQRSECGYQFVSGHVTSGPWEADVGNGTLHDIFLVSAPRDGKRKIACLPHQWFWGPHKGGYLFTSTSRMLAWKEIL